MVSYCQGMFHTKSLKELKYFYFSIWLTGSARSDVFHEGLLRPKLVHNNGTAFDLAGIYRSCVVLHFHFGKKVRKIRHLLWGSLHFSLKLGVINWHLRGKASA